MAKPIILGSVRINPSKIVYDRSGETYAIYCLFMLKTLCPAIRTSSLLSITGKKVLYQDKARSIILAREADKFYFILRLKDYKLSESAESARFTFAEKSDILKPSALIFDRSGEELVRRCLRIMEKHEIDFPQQLLIDSPTVLINGDNLKLSMVASQIFNMCYFILQTGDNLPQCSALFNPYNFPKC